MAHDFQIFAEIPADFSTGAALRLSEEQSHYVIKVLRRRVGDILSVVNDRSGDMYDAAVTNLGPPVEIRFVAARAALKQNSFVHTVCIPLLKGQRTELAVQKATELGACAIAVYEGKRSVRRLREDASRDRWTKIISEAARQCHRSIIPTCTLYGNLEEFLKVRSSKNIEPDSLLWCSLSRTATAMAELSPQLRSPVDIIAGPEGDFSEDEISLLKEYGAREVSLGPWLLRSETAIIAAVAVWQALSPACERGNR